MVKKMGFGKAFGLGLVIFIVLNFALNLLTTIVGGTDIGTYFNMVSSAPLQFVGTFFAPMAFLMSAPESIFLGLMTGINSISGGDALMGIMMILLVILPGLITAIIVGKLSETPGKGFLACLLIYIIVGVVFVVFALIDPTQIMAFIITYLMGTMWGSVIASETSLLIMFLILNCGVLSGMMWAGISAALAKEG